MDQTDRAILKLLEENAKFTNKELALRLNLTTTPVFERVKRLEREQYIKSYKAVIDRKKVGLSLVIYCNISLNEHQAEFIKQFEKDVHQFPEVVECYHVAGMFDYLLKVYATDMDAYQHFIAHKLASLDNIGKVQSSFVMTEVKQGGGLPLD